MTLVHIQKLEETPLRGRQAEAGEELTRILGSPLGKVAWEETAPTRGAA